MDRRHRKKLPAVWLMTDERVDDALLLAAASRLPKGRAGIIFRHYRTEGPDRHRLFARLKSIALRRRLTLMLGGSARQAAAWRADGWHGRDCRRARRPLLHSAPAHDGREMEAARRAGADFLLLSPLFPTRSHPGGRSLGRARFGLLSRQARRPVIALGGVRAEHRRMLKALGAAGWAGIDGLGGRV
ncbi:thiamine phosphate synthase [Sphingobium bisphenolivorans]|uniref:thiamine phosphate synthase n=1 Tax=Sphingobium bisphenolivorans TaxID=1335760 RepID=UPI0003B49D1F|nr:thiamine phosphate synthase [Sphingobium bisphenolivorans]